MPCNLVLDGEETLVEEVSETKCLCDQLKIERIIFLVFLIKSFLLLIWFLLLSIKRETRLFFFTLEDESMLVKMFLNKQETHNTKKRVVELVSRDAQEEV
jgi:hypothetical protein